MKLMATDHDTGNPQSAGFTNLAQNMAGGGLS